MNPEDISFDGSGDPLGSAGLPTVRVEAIISLDAISEAYLAKYGSPSCFGDFHDCTCASDKAAIRGFVEHLKANLHMSSRKP